MFYAYILQSISYPEEFYRGHTSNLKQRLAEHDAGKCPHTAKFAPWKVRFYVAFETLHLAQRFEAYLKTGSGHEFSKRHLGL
jgi:predicted GIY-YIG superfamily endonuclease